MNVKSNRPAAKLLTQDGENISSTINYFPH